MKIAVFHELQTLSGARKVVEEYGKILKQKHTVDLYYVDSTKDKETAKNFSNIFFFKLSRNKSFVKGWQKRLYENSIELIKLYFLHKQIAKLIKNSNYDFVFVNPSKYTQAPFILRFLENTVYFCQEPLRIVYDEIFKISVKNIFKRNYEKLNRKIRKAIDEQNIHKANIVLANSNFSRENIKNAYNIKATVCYLGVDIKRFINLNIPKKYDVLFVGGNSFVEGQELLKNALGKFDNEIIVKQVIRDNKGKGICEKELVKELNKARILVALSRSEPFGLISIEAMACSVPVVAVEEGGYKESVLDGKTGYLIDRNPDLLKEKIDILLSDEKLRKKMGIKAREHVVKNFTWQKSVNNFLKILNYD